MKLLHFLHTGISVREYIVLIDADKPDPSEWLEDGYVLSSISNIAAPVTAMLPTDRILQPDPNV